MNLQYLYNNNKLNTSVVQMPRFVMSSVSSAYSKVPPDRLRSF